MKKYQQKAGWFSPVKGYSFAIVALLVVSVCFAFFSQSRSDALTTVPTRMNFQGRLADSTGNIKPNGTYNMRLRLYTAASGGTAVWTEDRLVSAGTGITLTNGLFALQLGSVTSLPASLFASGPLYLEVELPTPATATTSSPSWLEGAMTPRNQMATSAYAYNSETLDGQDGSYYQDASNLAAGTLNSARITGAYANLTGTGALVSGSIASGFGTIATTNTIQGSRLISTVATGTAPLTVTSTTMVTNLNADLLDGQHGSYFQNASNLNAGTIADARLTSRIGQYAATVTDWDLATTNGWYMGYNIPNAPTASAWYIGDVVAHNYLWATQTVYAFTSDSSSNTQVWRRDSSDSGGTRVWGAWYRIQISQAEQDARYASISGSSNYIQNTTSPQTANINITGAITASGFTGSGSGLTNLSASNLSSGTINTARVSGAYTGITAVGTLSDVTVNGAAIINGSISRTENNVRTYKNVHAFNSSSANVTGTIALAAPKTWSNTMLRMSIKGYDYHTNTGAWEVIVSGYSYSATPAWINSSVEIRGKAPFSSVRLAHNGTNNVILLGTTSTVWQYPKVVIEEVIAGHSSIDGWGDGWTSSVLASETGYTNIVAPAVRTTLYAADLSGFVQLQGSTPGAAQTGNINVTGAVLSGSSSVSGTMTVGSSTQKVVEADSTTNEVTFGQASTADWLAKLSNPATTPTGTGNRVSYSPDGRYMSVAHFTSPFVTIYKRSGDTFTKLTNPTTLPTGSGYGTDFSPDGQYMTVAHATAPYITIYKRSGDTFTKLADPATLPTGIGISVAFSPDNQYMSVGHATAPYITIYERSGDTFTKLANPATTPGDNGNDVTFSPDGQYLSVNTSASPYIHIYKRSGDKFVKLSNPATLPTGSSFESAFSPDGVYMSVAHGTAPNVTIYKRSGDTFTKLADPATLPAIGSRGTHFSPDGQYLSLGLDNGPFVFVYKRSGDTFTKVTDAAQLPTGGGVSVSFSPNSQYLSVAHSNAPYVTTYRVGSGNSVDITLNGAISSTGAIQGSKLDITGFTNLQGGASIQGLLNVQGRGMFTQTDGTETALLIQGKPSPQFGDAPLFEIQDGAGGYLLTATQHVGNVVYVRGGSGFWGTAALQVAPAASNAYALKISGAGGQTASLIRVEDSAGNQLFAVGANGSVVSAAGLQGTTLSLSGSATVSGSVTAGSMYSSGWFYSTGDTGWYNSTYGGGIRMIDANWIRTYGSKYFYAESGLDTGGPSGIGCGGGLGGGYTFQVCGSQNVTGAVVISGGLTVGNANFAYGNPNSLSGIYLCKRTADNIVAMGASCSLASSARYKENISSISAEKALDILSKLRAVGFDWKSGAGSFSAANGDKADYGVIAEEVEQILPELVTKDANGQTIGVNYTGLIPFLIKAMQEQQSQIMQLQGSQSTPDTLSVTGSGTIGGNLNVSGATILKHLTVNGDAVVAGKLEVRGPLVVHDIEVNGHIITGGDALSIQPSSVFGVTDLSATVAGNDTTGTITITLNDQAQLPTGIDFVDGVSLIDARFAKQFGATPRILISPANASAGKLGAFTSNESQTGFTLSVGTMPQQGKAYKFTYWVAQ